MPPSGKDKRAVFLDRDGVLIRTDVRGGRPFAVRSFGELDVLDGAHEAVRLLRELGFLTVVVTNQPDVARGLADRAEVEAMHDHLKAALGIDDIRACYEEEGPESRCYKPRPGMLLDAAADLGIGLSGSYMIGDRWRDVGAGRAAGCFSIFIDCAYEEELRNTPDAVVGNVLEAAQLIVAREAARAEL